MKSNRLAHVVQVLLLMLVVVTSISFSSPKKRAGMGRAKRPWTNAKVYYEFAPEISDRQKETFQLAFTAWEIDTPLQFIPRTNEENYIRVVHGTNNSSSVGMGGSRQNLYVVSNDNLPLRTIVHELGHAIGLHHEHQRTDRDQYIDVFPEHLNMNLGQNISLKYHTVNYTPYDFRSACCAVNPLLHRRGYEASGRALDYLGVF